MSPLHRRRADAEGIPLRRPQPGVLRRERRLLQKARIEALGELGGLLVEMYRRGGFREDLLAERCAGVVGIDARLAEIEDLLHSRRNTPRCECGTPIFRGSHFCPNCGRTVDRAANGPDVASEDTVLAPRSGAGS
jgi:hypothetical protein